MILFRVMNSYDITINPLKNGIASKKLIYDITKEHLYNTKRELMVKLSQKELDQYIKNYMNKYLLEHKYKLDKIFKKRHIPIKTTIHNYVENKDVFSYFQIIKDLSSLPNHLINGSKTYTNWISTTNNFDGIWNYYDRQNIHGVLVIDVNTNGVFDENTYVVDLSNSNTINIINNINSQKEIDKIKLTRNEIISKSRNLPSILIKRR